MPLEKNLRSSHREKPGVIPGLNGNDSWLRSRKGTGVALKPRPLIKSVKSYLVGAGTALGSTQKNLTWKSVLRPHLNIPGCTLCAILEVPWRQRARNYFIIFHFNFNSILNVDTHLKISLLSGRPLRVHSLRVLQHQLPVLLVERRQVPRPRGASPGLSVRSFSPVS